MTWVYFPGINAQARKLQKTRSRGRSVVLGGRAADLGLSLCRSLSETDLRPSPEHQQSLKSQSGGKDSEAYKELPCEAGRKEETESGDDNCTQYSIHPPVHFPYFLLLQGFSYRQVVQTCPTSTTAPPPRLLLPLCLTQHKFYCFFFSVEFLVWRLFRFASSAYIFPRHPILYQCNAYSCFSRFPTCSCSSLLFINQNCVSAHRWFTVTLALGQYGQCDVGVPWNNVLFHNPHRSRWKKNTKRSWVSGRRGKSSGKNSCVCRNLLYINTRQEAECQMLGVHRVDTFPDRLALCVEWLRTAQHLLQMMYSKESEASISKSSVKICVSM